MKPANTVLLVVLGAAALGAGWYFGIDRTPAPVTRSQAGTLVFPDLAPKLQSAAKVEVVHGGQTVTLDHVGDGWGLASSSDYPVMPSKLREMLTGLTELRLTEPRTADPAEFARLEVEDPQASGAQASLVRVLDAAGKPIAELIIGRARPRAEGNVPDQLYIRRPGENQAWLAEGQVPLQTGGDPKQWLDKFVADIDPSRIATVSATRGADTLQFADKDGALQLTAPADHPPLDPAKLTEVGRALERMTFVDVRRDADLSNVTDVAHSSFATNDGAKVDAAMMKVGDETWIRLAGSGESADAKQLAERTKGWLYQLGSWKERNLFPTLDDLKAAPPAATPPGPPPGLPPGMTQGMPPGMPPMPAGHPLIMPPGAPPPKK